MIICIAEDREEFEVPLKILILSLKEYSPNVPIYLFHPPATQSFREWIQKHSNVTLCTKLLQNAQGWNVKPRAILTLFDLGFDNVIWIDSDIVVTREISYLFDELDYETLVLTEESLWGFYNDRECADWLEHRESGALRAALWGFKVRRSLPFTLNTAIIRATKFHRSLLETWAALLCSEQYQGVQALEWENRPIHMKGDQDVLTALLASSSFSSINLRILNRRYDITQYMGLFGFTILERLASVIHGQPAFVHAQALKPWQYDERVWRPRRFSSYIRAVYMDVSPYKLIASRYRDKLEGDVSWMSPHFLLSTILRAIGLSRPALVGAPIAAIADLIRVIRVVTAKAHTVSSLRF